MDAVLQEHDAGHGRMIARREEHEPAVVAQVLARPRGGASSVRDHLRRPGLARNILAGDSGRRAGATAVHHHPESVADRLQLFRIDLNLRLRRRPRHRLPAGAIVDGFEQVRRDARAAVGERRHVHGHRHRRHRHLALADADRNRFAGVPLLVAHAHLPFGGRHEPLILVRQIDSALHAEAERRRPLVDLVDAHHVGDGIEIDVARLLDRVTQIDRAVAALLPTFEGTPVKCRRAGAVRVEVGGDDPFFETGERHGHLERRPW